MADTGSASARRAPPVAVPPVEIRETVLAGTVPRYAVPGWAESGFVAGITGRGEDFGRGFDLGLWSDCPVGETMARWRTFRRSEPAFQRWSLGGQVHGAVIAEADSARGWLQLDGVDGWTTRASGTMVTVTVADCIPVYLGVPGRGGALLHAGWRGTAAGILASGFERLLELTAATPADVMVHAGVGICGPCYEVGREVMAGCNRDHAGAGPWHIDLRAVLAEEAKRLGAVQVTVSAWCSSHDRPAFYSHRGSGGTDGRMVAYLGRAH